jgi:hypothetical protein
MGFDSKSYKAFRIVIQHWIIPSNIERKRKSANIINRWWVRINGSYKGFRIYDPLPLTESFPPGLWRQMNVCNNCFNKNNKWCCRNFKNRWEKRIIKNCIKTFHIKKYVSNKLKNENIRVSYLALEDRFGREKVRTYMDGWRADNCGCNLMPAHTIINFHKYYRSIKHIFYLMAGDTLSTKARCKVSNYLYNRLKPK